MDVIQTHQSKQLGEEIFVGGEFRGRKITEIYSKGSDYCIFQCQGVLGFEYIWTTPPEKSSIFYLREEALHQFEITKRTVEQRFQSIPIPVIEAALLSLLRAIFKVDKNNLSIASKFSEVNEIIKNTPAVKRVLASSRDYCVWINEDGSMHYRHSAALVGVDSAIAEYTRLKAIAQGLLPEKHLTSFSTRLGAALVVSFKSAPKINLRDIFGPVETLLNETIKTEIKVKSLSATTVLCTVLIAFGTFAYYKLSPVGFLKMATICATGGVAGSLISFLERSRTIDFQIDDSHLLTILGNTSRIGLGALFGVLAYSATEIGLAFSIFKGSNFGLLLLGVAAGFSERLIPDMLGSITNQKSGRNK